MEIGTAQVEVLQVAPPTLSASRMVHDPSSKENLRGAKEMVAENLTPQKVQRKGAERLRTIDYPPVQSHITIALH